MPSVLAGSPSALLLHGQSESRQLLPRRLVAMMPDRVHAETGGHLDEHRAVLDVGHPPRVRLRDVEGDAEDVLVGLAEVDIARDDEEVDEGVEPEPPDAV